MEHHWQPCNTMEGHGIILRAFEGLGTPWKAMDHHWVLWNMMEGQGGPWNTIEGHGTPLGAMEHPWGPLNTIEGHGGPFIARESRLLNFNVNPVLNISESKLSKCWIKCKLHFKKIYNDLIKWSDFEKNYNDLIKCKIFEKNYNDLIKCKLPKSKLRWTGLNSEPPECMRTRGGDFVHSVSTTYIQLIKLYVCPTKGHFTSKKSKNAFLTLKWSFVGQPDGLMNWRHQKDISKLTDL